VAPDELTVRTASELRDLLSTGDVSAVEVAQAYLARVAAHDELLGAFCFLEPEAVLEQARALDNAYTQQGPMGLLHGLPVGVKDLIFTKGTRTAGGSPVYKDFVPDEDDVSVERIRRAGGVIMGKTNTAEFGFSANQTANEVGGITRNPWKIDRTPGGSSGGSAAAMAARFAALTLASDGGGSIRIPSAFCGVFGFKPTFGRVPLYPGCRDPRYPGFSAWESVEHIGPITRCVKDAALVLDVLVGADPRDRHSLPSDGVSFLDGLLASPQGLRGLRIAWSADWGGREPVALAVRAGLERAVAVVAEAGADVVEAAPDRPAAVQSFGATIALDADPDAVRKMIREHPAEVGPRLQALMQREWTIEELGRAGRERKALYSAIEGFLQEYDAWLTPAVPVTAYGLGMEGPDRIGEQMIPEADRPRAVMGFAWPFNLTGHPAASVPISQDEEDLPVGVQVVTARLRDVLALRISHIIEEGSGMVTRAPTLQDSFV
jgi:aspartyl-tRNA(Asn)/glutamyl-tRNA(Gln) amidotransferase subunit A